MIVVDASALLEALLQTDVAPSVEARMFDVGQSINAPHLIDLEVAQVLRRWVAAGDITEGRALQALADLADFPLTRSAPEQLLPRVWELRHHLTAYDAAYVALAEALDAPLLTCDRRLASAPGHDARIELV